MTLLPLCRLETGERGVSEMDLAVYLATCEAKPAVTE
jgi:hypothetical protein